MNKNGADKVLAVYWFAILAIIAGSVVAMVLNFYRFPYDVREIEAGIMTEKIADCISEAGKLNKNFNENFDIAEICHINLNSEEDEYYIETNFYDFEIWEKLFQEKHALENPILTFSTGNSNIKTDCEIQKEKEYGLPSRCDRKGFYVNGGEKKYFVEVLSVVRKTSENVK
ncbi:MAG: hypothetical protein AABX28_01600 [Nanoarchaeota archaeon]